MGLLSQCIDRLKHWLGFGSGGAEGAGGRAPDASADVPLWVMAGINNNPRVATYAAYVEYGWVQTVTARQTAYFTALGVAPVKTGTKLVNPPRPFFRQTIADNADKWATVARNAVRRQLPHYDQRNVLEIVGIVMADDIRAMIASGEGMARRSPLTLAIYAALAERGGHSTGGLNNTTTDKPLVNTGTMLGSITYQIGHD